MSEQATIERENKVLEGLIKANQERLNVLEEEKARLERAQKREARQKFLNGQILARQNLQKFLDENEAMFKGSEAYSVFRSMWEERLAHAQKRARDITEEFKAELAK